MGVAIAVAFNVVGCAADEPAADEAPSEDALSALPPIFEAPRAPHVTANPIVLVHAFNGSATNSWSFNGVKEALEGDGHFVYVADLPPYAGTPLRAGILRDQLTEARTEYCAKVKRDVDPIQCLTQTKVNMIGHSQGGLDGRYVISRLGYAENVASLTTISAPHRGTPIGDVGVGLLGRNDPISNEFFKLIAYARTSDALAQDTKIGDALFWLSEKRANDPQYDMPSDPRVAYFSWAGIASVRGTHDDQETAADLSACEGKVFGTPGRTAKFDLVHDASFIALIPLFTRADQKPNDGHIPVNSAKWGEFQGCVPADHLDLIGRPAEQHREPSEAGFDHLTFYRVIADTLGKRGL